MGYKAQGLRKQLQESAMSFLHEVESRGDSRKTEAPLVDREDALRIVNCLHHGLISAMRMAKALDASFEDMDATFAHHGISYAVHGF
ncbi:hypothetical protein ACEUZ9_000998 [Paracoccus litorisediminis]|uniref:hypothetical protein n=1 Tax=Paracoccus litorisediminis TaxID=2006130 RepID=UPI00373063C2